MGGEESKPIAAKKGKGGEDQDEDDTNHPKEGERTIKPEEFQELGKHLSQFKIKKENEDEEDDDGLGFLDDMNFDFEQEEDWDSGKGSLDSKTSQDRVGQYRKTLATYNEFANLDSAGEKGSDDTKKREKKRKKEFATIVKQRSRVTLRKGKTLRELRHKDKKELKRMNNMKKAFFDTLNTANKATKSVAHGANQVGRQITHQVGSAGKSFTQQAVKTTIATTRGIESVTVGATKRTSVKRSLEAVKRDGEHLKRGSRSRKPRDSRPRNSRPRESESTRQTNASDILSRAIDYNVPWIEQVEKQEGLIEDAANFRYAKVEKELREKVNKANEAIESDAKQKQKLEETKKKIDELRKVLLTRQKNHFATAKEEAVRLEKLIKAKLKELESKQKKKLGENYRVTHAELIEEHEASKKKKRNFFSFASKEAPKKKMAVSPIQAEQEEQRYKKEIETLHADVQDLREALTLMKLEKQFPKTMRWKLRVDSGGGLYIGMRDVEIEKLKAKYHVQSGGEEGVIRMRVYDLEAVFGILQFVFAGKSYLAKFLGGVFTPTVNRLDLICKGEWELWLKYNEKTASWDEDTRRSKFNLDFKKKVTGITTIRLPAAFVKLLTNTIFPILISAGLKEAFPAQLATFQYEGKEASNIPYLAQPETHIDIQGNFTIVGDMSPGVWRCPLYGPTTEAIAGRKALGGEFPVTLEEAVILDYMLRGPRAIAAGFSPKAATLARLYKWRLKYASYNLSELEELFDLIQEGAQERMPPGWFAQIMYRVELLALKPVTFDLSVTSAKIDVDLTEITKTSMQMFLGEKERDLEAAESDKAKAVAQKELNQFKSKILKTLNSISFAKNILNDSVHGLVSLLIHGGEDGFVALELADIQGEGRVPDFRLPTVIPSQEEDIPIEVHGEDGPEEGEYTVMIYDPVRGEANEKENGTFITVSDTRLELLPKGGGPGCVRLRSERLRASSFFPSLDDVLTFLLIGEGKKDEDKPKRVKFKRRNREVRRLLNESYAVVTQLKGVSPSKDISYSITEEEEESNPYSQLPDFMIFDKHKFLAEARAVRTMVQKRGEEMRLVMTYNEARHDNLPPLKLRMRQNLADAFEVL